MIISYSKAAVPIRLTDERWKHIIERHPELRGEIEKVIKTISNPDFVQEGDGGELLAVKFYKKTSLTSKYVIVAYKEISKLDGFIITAYLANRSAEWRKIIWKP